MEEEPGSPEVEILLDLMLREDRAGEDVTSAAAVAEGTMGAGRFLARAPGVVAGLPFVVWLCRRHDPAVRIVPKAAGGARVGPGDAIAEASGPLRSLLQLERPALNLLARLSGVATLTRRFVDRVAGLPVKIVDTRKTTPGLRALEKYAVRMGGGANHRMSLADMALFKDNHLAAGLAAGLAPGPFLRQAKGRLPAGCSVGVEVDRLEFLDEVLAEGPDLILLDNMAPAVAARAIERIRRRREATGSPRPLAEVSGGITLENVRAYAEAGPDRISIGALTHSAPALDLSFEIGPGA